MTWRIWLAGAGVVLVLIVVGILAWNFDPFGRRKNAETKAANATAQSTADLGTVQAVDHYTHETIVLREKADHAERIIRQAPGANDPIPPELRTALCDQLSSLRDGKPACADADDPLDPPT